MRVRDLAVAGDPVADEEMPVNDRAPMAMHGGTVLLTLAPPIGHYGWLGVGADVFLTLFDF